ncbi:vegetative catalase-like [Schistocerca gregaria]|uniref:vegetative catalase-like n=1 Tax=Schistocerca gregaria TaxID=7010 RepID=UPI00211F3F7F|nr:vegetative catalase-like [Schistocerca gregaria]
MSNLLSSANGIPLQEYGVTETAGKFGGLTLSQDTIYFEKLGHFHREVIPERRVHAKGSGAYGYFEVTADMTKYCKAKFLNEVGKQTPVFARFSLVVGERGSSDVARDVRGFALKFYTEEGNWDMVGNNTPIFFISDAIRFPDLIHAMKRHPQTNLVDPTTAWDFWSSVPESTHQVLMLFTDRGIPDGYRHMNGYGSHTFKWVNDKNEVTWVKFHFKTEAGIKCLLSSDPKHFGVLDDPDYSSRDLYEHIANNKEACWKAYVQLMPYDDAWTYKIDPFDLTRVWSHKDYPLIEYGRLVLNRNPTNYHAEVEQVAFSPANFVPGIEPSPDKVLQGRLYSYMDSQFYRLCKNYTTLPINCPYRVKIQNYHRDGITHTSNGENKPTYWPNSFGGPNPDPAYNRSEYKLRDTNVGRYPTVEDKQDYFTQPGCLYRNVLKEDERQRVITNIAGSLSFVSSDQVKARAIKNFYMVDKDLGTQLAQKLDIKVDFT